VRVLRITPVQQAVLGQDYRRRFAGRLAAALGRPDLAEVVGRYIDEGVAAGVRLERELEGFCRLLLEVDGAGKRPPALAARLADPAVSGDLKVLQMQGAWIDYLEGFR
jgi:hypothetical protein